MNETDLQQQAQAIASSTRFEIYRYLLAADEAVGVAELTEYLGLNHNAIRQHLAKLVESGLVLETTEKRTTPGRPRRLYRPDPKAEASWRTDGPYQRLSKLLVEVVSSGKSPIEVGRDAGRRITVSRGEGDDGFAPIVEAIARGGFDPEPRRDGNQVDLVLRNCPFVDAALVDPDTVCDLHLGLAQGLADQVPNLEVESLRRADPRKAGCRLRFKT